ncbi:MAG: hypothetical protein WCA19_10390 [Candidatus Acidiferrales bacterium]
MNAPSKAGREKAKQRNMAFGAYPKEVNHWKKLAAKADRSLSWWLRNRIAEAEKLALDQKSWDPPTYDTPQISVSVGVFPKDIDRWERKARAINRPRGWLLRKCLLAMDDLDRQPAAQAPAPEAIQETA